MRLISATIPLLYMLSSCDGGGISEGRIPDPKTDKASDRHAPQHARIIAPKVYICGFPIVDNHRIQHSYFVARDNAEYMNPYHVRYNNGRVFTPAEKAMQTLNADTPHRNLDLDLRTEPIELTVSAWEKDRYFSLQVIDAELLGCVLDSCVGLGHFESPQRARVRRASVLQRLCNISILPYFGIDLISN